MIEIEINGYASIKNIDFICYLVDSNLILISKNKNNSKAFIKANDVVGKWIKVESTTKIGNYFFHVVRYKYYTDNSYELLIDYYAEMMTQKFNDDFLSNNGDGILLTSNVIGEYIKDTIDFTNEDSNSISVKFPIIDIECCIDTQKYNFKFTYDFDKNPHYYGLSCLKPNLYVQHSDDFESLIRCFVDVKELFSFIFRKRTISISSFTILKTDNLEKTLYPLCEIYSTVHSKNEDYSHSIISSNIAKHFPTLFNLVKNKAINCFHLPKNSDYFEPSQLIMLFSWFEKLYKLVPLNDQFELDVQGEKKQIIWKERTKNGNKKRVTEKQQLENALADNPVLKDLSFEVLMSYGGFKESERFIKECTKRIVDFRNDVVHNKDIYSYDFIIQDRIFIELINYYLIFKYLCKCSEEETVTIIKQIFSLV